MSDINFDADRRANIYAEIEAERAYQIDKWGIVADDTANTPWMWASYIAQYSTRWMSGLFHITRNCTDAFRKAMIKTACICVAAVESIDRQRDVDGKPFYEVDA